MGDFLWAIRASVSRQPREDIGWQRADSTLQAVWHEVLPPAQPHDAELRAGPLDVLEVHARLVCGGAQLVEVDSRAEPRRVVPAAWLPPEHAPDRSRHAGGPGPVNGRVVRDLEDSPPAGL